jgi:TRAP-type C4-dicarboxylate transport system substrate-binding protein
MKTIENTSSKSSKSRGNKLWILGAIAAVVGAGVASEVRAAEVIKIGTLAPKSSPWGKVFETWVKGVSEKSGGKLDLQFFYNGTQGDEGGMVGKMKSGQLDGAAVTAVGLSKIYKPIVALQAPGLFTTWAKLDSARNAVKGEFEKGASDAGFTILGWGDVGLARVMTKGFKVITPDDVKGKKPYHMRDDEFAPKLYSLIGGVTPVPLNTTEVLTNLNTGAINMVTAPALAAEQLQWAGKLDHISDSPAACAIGGLVVSKKKLDGLPADLKKILTDTGAVAATALTSSIRREDDAAYARLKGKMTVFSPDASKWQGKFTDTRNALKGSYPVLGKLEGMK